MMDETQIPASHLNSSAQEFFPRNSNSSSQELSSQNSISGAQQFSPHNSNSGDQECSSAPNSNQTSFLPQYFYFPTYNCMGYFQPDPIAYNIGFMQSQFPYYYQTGYNMEYVQPLLFPYYQTGYDMGHVQPQFTLTSTSATSSATEPRRRRPPPQQPPPDSLSPCSNMPSRTLLLSMMPTSVSESTLWSAMEVFGEVRAVEMERLKEGLVTVHFYDLRNANDALVAIQEQYMQQKQQSRCYGAATTAAQTTVSFSRTAQGPILGQAVWAQFSSAVPSPLPDGHNQGTLVVFNLDIRISSAYLKEVFGAFGTVKEVRETPHKMNQRFVEFYDVREAAKAKESLDGMNIYGRKILVEFGRPGGLLKKLPTIHQNGALSRHNRSTHSYSQRNSCRSLLQPTTSLKCKLSGQIALLNDNNPEGNTGGSGGSSNSSNDGSEANLCFSGHLECSSIQINNNNSSKLSNLRLRDDRFMIEEDAIMNSRDPRTTVMIRNIPNRCSLKHLLKMLDNLCNHSNEKINSAADGHGAKPLSSYDFVYLPVDFIHKSNMGYGFVNMTSPQAALSLYKALHNRTWDSNYYSKKICKVTYARIQGIEEIREHFKNAEFRPDMADYMPVVFSPPRDGRRLTDPVPISNRVPAENPPQVSLYPPSSPSSSKDNQSEPPDEDDEYGETGYLHIPGLA